MHNYDETELYDQVIRLLGVVSYWKLNKHFSYIVTIYLDQTR